MVESLTKAGDKIISLRYAQHLALSVHFSVEITLVLAAFDKAREIQLLMLSDGGRASI
jgi:hypothetical protein